MRAFVKTQTTWFQPSRFCGLRLTATPAILCHTQQTEVRAGGYRRVALQFPDALLPDAPAVCRLLAVSTAAVSRNGAVGFCLFPLLGRLSQYYTPPHTHPQQLQQEGQEPPPTCEEEPTTTAPPPFFFIIGDTSYGACCADEVAAQHLLADCIVHYGPACLSPTARLPVVHVFGRRPLRDPQTAAAGIAR